MFDYGEFTRILKHGAKDPDDKWPMSHPFLAGLAAKVTSKATQSVQKIIWTLSNAKKIWFRNNFNHIIQKLIKEKRY